MYRSMRRSKELTNMGVILQNRPDGIAYIRGSSDYPDIYGTVWFYQTDVGVMVVTELYGLPMTVEAGEHPVFGFHIHEGERCAGNESDPFGDVGSHYNPENEPHPYHAGDLAPLFGNQGYALGAVLTDRFTVREVIGKTVIVHSHPDDFHTQPSGNSGVKMACGMIQIAAK